MTAAIDDRLSRPESLPRGMELARSTIHFTLVPWLMMALVSPMAYDSGDDRLAATMMIGVWSYAPLALLCSWAGRVLWSKGRRGAAVVAVAIPLGIVSALLLGILATSGLP
jgi:hypothetical protein